jgi:hypothetical protein
MGWPFAMGCYPNNAKLLRLVSLSGTQPRSHPNIHEATDNSPRFQPWVLRPNG